MELNIALLKGDGIGPEIVDGAVAVLEKIADKFGHTFNFTPYLIGGCAIDAVGMPLPQETVDGCLASDSAHNKTIQKAIESYRIPTETKDYLKMLKV